MAYLTFDPSTKEIENRIAVLAPIIEETITNASNELGVSQDDILLRFLNCRTKQSSEGTPEHVEIVLKTDSIDCTAPMIVEILKPVLQNIKFEVSRIHVGYLVEEIEAEKNAYEKNERRNWASNY